MVQTAKSRHGNEKKSLELHLGLGVVSGFCFESLIGVSRVETKSMLEYLLGIVGARHLDGRGACPVLIHQRFPGKPHEHM
jgi:hypothetical protein